MAVRLCRKKGNGALFSTQLLKHEILDMASACTALPSWHQLSLVPISQGNNDEEETLRLLVARSGHRWLHQVCYTIHHSISGLVLRMKMCCLSLTYSMARYSWSEERTGAHHAVFMNMQSSHVHVHTSIKVPCQLGQWVKPATNQLLPSYLLTISQSSERATVP